MYKIGTSTVIKILEMDLNGMTLKQLMPDLPDDLDESQMVLEGAIDGQGGARLSLHSWLVQHNGLNILIDTGAGNDKARPHQKVLDNLKNPFLERLEQAGVKPEAVDIILHTHIHSDHVGWDTRLVNGQWVPTFPNAKVICSRLEWDYGLALSANDEAAAEACRRRAAVGKPVRTPGPGTFLDSIRPLEGKVEIDLISVAGGRVVPGIRFLPTPGHSIDHASIEVVSSGEMGLFSGDVFHHPVEIALPDVVSMFCEFPDLARRSRKEFMDHASQTQAIVFTSHFPGSSAGLISKGQDGYQWAFC